MAIGGVMLRWLVMLLALALPLRDAMAAQQVCVWMGGTPSGMLATSPAPADLSADMPADCEGMSMADEDHCTLQAGCGATPLLTPTAQPLAPAPVPRPADAADLAPRPVPPHPPEHVPIVMS